MFESWALDVVDKCQSTIVLDVFIDNSLAYELWLTYGLMVFSLEKNNSTYDGDLAYPRLVKKLLIFTYKHLVFSDRILMILELVIYLLIL